jgi:hypothetical protein
VSRVKHTASQVKHTEWLVKHTASQVKHTASQVKHTASQVKHTASQVKHTASQVKHTALQVKHTVLQVKHTASRVKHTASRVKHRALRVKHTAFLRGALVIRRFRTTRGSSRNSPRPQDRAAASPKHGWKVLADTTSPAPPTTLWSAVGTSKTEPRCFANQTCAQQIPSKTMAPVM